MLIPRSLVASIAPVLLANSELDVIVRPLLSMSISPAPSLDRSKLESIIDTVLSARMCKFKRVLPISCVGSMSESPCIVILLPARMSMPASLPGNNKFSQKDGVIIKFVYQYIVTRVYI